MISNSILIEEDLEYITSKLTNYEELRNASFLITGSTGLIGKIFTYELLYLNDKYNLNLHLNLNVRNKEKTEELFKKYIESEIVSVFVSDIRNKMNIEKQIDYIVHCASVTSSNQMVNEPVDTITTSIIGTNNLLEMAITKNIKDFLYVSSMEVYGQFPEETIVNEECVGNLDWTKTRSSYPESKRLCESLCLSYAKQHNLPVKIARLAQTFGPGVSDGDNRLYMQIANCIINDKDLVLSTDGESYGNYCYIADTIYGLFTILLKGMNGEIYNICNEQMSQKIKDLAIYVFEQFDCRKHVITNNNKDDKKYLSNVKYLVDSSKMRSLGWTPSFSVIDGFDRLIKHILFSK